MLKRFCNFQHAIKSFMVSKNKFVLELDNENWLTDIVFLVVLSPHLNELIMDLQGETTYQHHVPNHNSIPNETEIMASLN